MNTNGDKTNTRADDMPARKPIWRKALKIMAIAVSAIFVAFMITVNAPEFASKARYTYLHAVRWVCHTLGVNMPKNLSDELAEEPLPDDILKPQYFDSLEAVEAKYNIKLLKPAWLPEGMKLTDIMVYLADSIVPSIYYEYSNGIDVLYYSVTLYLAGDAPTIPKGESSVKIGSLTYELGASLNSDYVHAETRGEHIYYYINSGTSLDTLIKIIESNGN